MVKTIALVSGKGGVGKTCLAFNLGASLVMLGRRVLVIDADLAMPNLGLYAGLGEKFPTLYDVLKKDKGRDITSAIQRVYVHGRALDIIPCSFSLRDFLNADLNVLSKVVTELSPSYDYILLDTASGLNKHSLVPPRLADQVIFVITPEPASSSDSSRLKLALQVLEPKLKMSAVLNKFKKGRITAADVQSKLGIETPVEIPDDDEMDESIRKRVPLILYKPKSKAARAIMRLANLVVMREEVPVAGVGLGKEEKKSLLIKKIFKEGNTWG